MSDLALFGGTPVLAEPLRSYPSMGEAECEAVVEVVRSGCLSGFFGSPCDEFFGGPKVRAFEAAWSQFYDVKHTISVNSNTSGLLAALGAVGVGPGDEVIIPPTTMSATAITPLFWGGVPVFADIEDRTFCLDPNSVKAAMSPRTKAIVVVNLFGHPGPLRELRELADAHGVHLIEDNAQSPLGHEDGAKCGTVGHIGVFSLNYHKHIHTGEGGMCVTNDKNLADRMALIRNHGENAHQWLGIENAANVIGLNLRQTELGAAIGLVQLGNIDAHVGKREHIAERLSETLSDLEGLMPPAVRPGCRHNYYCWVLRYDAEAVGVSRETFSRALEVEGFPHGVGYLAPLYTLPAFQQRRAIGRDGWPFTGVAAKYEPGICPVAERLHKEEIMLFEPCAWDIDEKTLDRLCEALRKVHAHRGELSNRAD